MSYRVGKFVAMLLVAVVLSVPAYAQTLDVYSIMPESFCGAFL